MQGRAGRRLYVAVAQGLEQATALAEAAEATGFQPLIAEAWLLVAQFQYLGSAEGAAAVESAHRAARAALATAACDDELTVD